MRYRVNEGRLMDRRGLSNYLRDNKGYKMTIEPVERGSEENSLEITLNGQVEHKKKFYRKKLGEINA
jgi:hypothetical protein